MKIHPAIHWNITSRLIFITVLPVVLMFFSVVAWSYFSRYAEIQQDLDERGQLIASALAVSSQYGLISGNLSGVETGVRKLLHADKSIHAVEIYDVQKNSIIKIADGALSGDNLRVYEAPIWREMVALDAFSEDEEPHVSATVRAPQKSERSRDVVGYVKVTMSPAVMLAAKRHRIVIGSVIAGIFLLSSAVGGLYLARGLTLPLASTMSALRLIRAGSYNVKIDARAGGEIGELQDCILEIAQSLSQFKQDMEGKVLSRTQALIVARDEAVKSNEEKIRLIQKVNSVVEEERKSIAIDIHDHLNAMLIVARLESRRILDLVARETCGNVGDEIKGRAQAICELMSDLYEMARNIVKRLRPEVIDTLGLRNAVEEMVRQYDSIHPTCRFYFDAKGDIEKLPIEVAISAYRLIQEALSNVVKHSNATVAHVMVEYSGTTNIFRIIVDDNGRGFDSNGIAVGIGMIGMRERVAGLGGQLEIKSVLDVGTKIIIRVALCL